MAEEKYLKPNTTQIPNILLDWIIPQLPEGEAKCLLYICRRTFGFHKEYDRISFSQFIDGIEGKDAGAGVSRPVIAKSLKNLVVSGAIIMTETTKGNVYKINLEMDIEQIVNKVNQLRKEKKIKPKQTKLFKPVKKLNQLRNLTEIGLETLPKPVKFPNLQNKGNKGNKDIYKKIEIKEEKPWTKKPFSKLSFRGMPVVKDKFTGKLKALDNNEWLEIDDRYLSEVKSNK